MNLKEIQFKNYCQFHHAQRIQFSSDNNNQNITLISGPYASGKTSILHAILFCLYGEQWVGFPLKLIDFINPLARKQYQSMGNRVESYIQLRLYPSYGLPEGTQFSAILFPSPKTYFHYKNFYNTYMLGQFTDALDTAIGRWGCVQISPSTLAGVEYSAVRFVYQTMPIRMKSWRIEREERNNVSVGGAG